MSETKNEKIKGESNHDPTHEMERMLTQAHLKAITCLSAARLIDLLMLIVDMMLCWLIGMLKCGCHTLPLASSLLMLLIVDFEQLIRQRLCILCNQRFFLFGC